MSENQTAVNQPIEPKFNKLVDTKEFKFRFKKDKLGNQRAGFILNLGVPSVEGLAEILMSGDEKQIKLLQDAVEDVVRSAALGIVSENEEVTDKNFPYDQITWANIANQDRADRRSVSIPEETWKLFAEDYAVIMPAAAARSKDQIEAALYVFLKKLSPIKTNKKALESLKIQLGLYVQHTQKGEELSEVIELLNRKLETYLAADDQEALLKNLL